MQLGWIDYSRQERDTIKELLKILGEPSSVDELGVGIVRDSISDLLYPGTSVLHTRAKYYILIPELFKKAMKSGLTTMPEVRKLIDSDQDKIARALRRAVDEETGTKASGIIGGRSDRAVKMKPARIYWNAMRTTEILCHPNLSFDDACSAVASYNRNNKNTSIKYESDEAGGDAEDAGLNGFSLFNTPCMQNIDDYIANPTLHLTKVESMYLMEQFKHPMVMKNTLMEYCLKNKQSYAETAFSDVEIQSNMPPVLSYNIELAKEFADFIYGAYIVYNLLFFENGGDNATGEQKQYLEDKYSEWKQQTCGIPHREEILKLVRNHEHYKAALNKFLFDFEKAVMVNNSDACSDEEKRLIRDRERFCKRGKAKIGGNYPYQPIQSSPMNYRHSTGQVIIEDILKGLVRDNG